MKKDTIVCHKIWCPTVRAHVHVHVYTCVRVAASATGGPATADRGGATGEGAQPAHQRGEESGG